MKTKLLHHPNSFTYECTAKVVAVEGDEGALDATVFFPGGGGRMAFAMENLDRERIAYIERKINEAVEANYPIRVYSLPRERAFEIPDLVRTKINLLPPDIQDVRIVEIVGLDLQADGGTHVEHTGEVGAIKITKTENKGKINKRLEIVLRNSIEDL